MTEAAIAPPAAPAAPAVPPAAPTNDPWFQGADAEIIGHIQSKGWSNKAANEVALEAIKAARAAEKFVGVPTDQLIRMPKDAADEPAIKALWARLGKPADAKEYDFSAIKFTDGTPLDDKFSNFMREKAFALNMPKDMATAMTTEFAKFLDSAAISDKAEIDAKLIEEKKALATNWGPNMAANTFVAQQGAKVLGLTPEDVAALESVVGYAKVMEAMRKVGVLNKEDAYVAGNGSTSGGVMTKEQAEARRTELINDKAWAKSYAEGDAAKAREMKALLTIISGIGA